MRLWQHRGWPPLVCATLMLLGAVTAHAQMAGDFVKIGVLTDLSGPDVETDGKGSVISAQMAADDFGGKVRGRGIEIITAEHQNKPDIAAIVAQRWFDLDKVDALITPAPTPIALAVQAVAKERQRTVLATGIASSDLTTKSCTLVSTHWGDDTHALGAGMARALLGRGGKKWFFLTADRDFGLALQRDASQVIEADGGKVVGSAKFPVDNPDVSGLVLRAGSSGADVIGVASAGSDLINIVKQAKDAGLPTDKQILGGFLVYITDVHALGLQVAQHLTFASSFYWDESDASRRFARRFSDAAGSMPTRNHAASYTALRHYLTAVNDTGTDDPIVVNQAMRRLPVDYLGRPATVRADGRVLYDLTLYRAKTPAESHQPWDYYASLGPIAKEDAFLPMNAACGP